MPFESYALDGKCEERWGCVAVQDTYSDKLSLHMPFILLVLYKRRKQINKIGKDQGIISLSLPPPPLSHSTSFWVFVCFFEHLLTQFSFWVKFYYYVEEKKKP